MNASAADPERFRRLQELFHAARELPTAERAAFLQQQCGGDDELRVDVERLLARTEREEPESARPERIGLYRILDVIGEGGMGTVYLAEQQEPVKRRVALKLIKLGMDSKAVVARFLQERQALALMDHEGIAKVFDCGTSDRGQPYFVMELVKGIPLDRFCEQQRLSLPDRLLLMRQVCAAVQHAHQKGVVHRDLKPSNILVSDHLGRMQVKIIDFGLAKAMGQKLLEATFFTEAGQIVGTPEYMAPEQADPTNQDIDTRADIYSLGVMLFQLLVSELPFQSHELRRAGLLEVQRILREVDPPRPSTKLTTIGDAATEVARTRRTSVSALKKALKNDLDWVVLKALEKERNRRYETVNALSADLQRFLDHEPLDAGPPSAGYRLKKLLRKHRGQVAAATAVLATAIVGTAVAWDYAIDAKASATLAYEKEQEASLRAEENAKLAREKGALATNLERVAAEQRQQLVEASWAAFNQADRLLAEADAAKSAAVEVAKAREGLLHLTRALVFDPSNGVAWERFAHEALHRKAVWRLPNEMHAPEGNLLTFSPDGTRVLASNDKTAQLWDVTTGKVVQKFAHENFVWSATFNPDGTRVLTASNDKTAKLWDVTTGKVVQTFAHEDFVRSATFSPDGTRVLTASNDKTAKLWDVATGKEAQTFAHENTVWSATFSPDGTRVLTASSDKTAKLWDVAIGKAVQTFTHESMVWSATFSPDGTRVLTASSDKTAKLWDVTTGTEVQTFAHEGDVRSATFSPEGTRVLTASNDKTAKLWDVPTGTEVQTFAHEDTVWSATFSFDGARVLTASEDKTAKLWDVTSGKVVQTFAHEDMIFSATFSPDGMRVLTSSRNTKLWDVTTGKVVQTFAHEDMVSSATFSPDGMRVLTASSDKTAKLWDATSGRVVQTFAHEDMVSSATFSPDGMRVLTASSDKTAKLWNVTSGKVVQTFAHEGEVRSATFSPDGSRVLTASSDKTAKLWEATTGKEVHTFAHEDSGVSAGWAATFSPDGTRVLTAGERNIAKLWDVKTGIEVHKFAHEGEVRSAMFSPDGSRVLTASSDKTAKLWDVTTGKVVQKFAHEDFVWSATFSPDGMRVLTVTSDKTVQLWDVTTGKVAQTFAHEDFGWSATFSPDGSRLMTVSSDHTAKLWDVTTGKVVQTFAHEGQVNKIETFSPDGTLVLTLVDNTVKLWDVASAREVGRSAAPRDVTVAVAVAELLTGHTLSIRSELAPVTSERQGELRATWQQILQDNGSLTPVVRWLAAHGPDAPAWSAGSITCRERAEVLSELGGPINAREALHLDPAHPLVNIALAADASEAEARRAFLRDYDLKRLPADAAICARAATLLLAQGDKARALTAANRALAVDPTNATALEVAAKVAR